MPGVAVEEIEQVLEGAIGNGDLGVFLLDAVRQEQAAVEVLDLAEQLLGLGGPLPLGFGEPFEEERLQELGVDSGPCPGAWIPPACRADRIWLPPSRNPGGFFWRKVNKHQAIQQYRGIPAPLPFVGDATDQFQESDVLILKVAEELLGDAFDVEGGLQPLGDINDADVTLGVEFGEVEDHLAELAEEQVAGLALEVEVIARDLLALLPLDPVPEALCSLSVHEDQKILVVKLDDLLVDAVRVSWRPGSSHRAPRPPVRRPRPARQRGGKRNAIPGHRCPEALCGQDGTNPALQ